MNKHVHELLELEHIEKITDLATYKCYAYNRTINPDHPVEAWRTIFPDIDNLEKRYQLEQKIKMS